MFESQETENAGEDIDTQEDILEDSKPPLASLPPLPTSLAGVHNLPLPLPLAPVVVSAKKLLRLQSSPQSGNMANGAGLHSEALRRSSSCTGTTTRKKCCHHPDILSREMIFSL